MNKQPIRYFQTDKWWAKIPYQVPGETTDIAESGCGPTSAAMLIETLTGKTFTPVDACRWSVEHGYKALRKGTYHSYFVPQFAKFGIKCTKLLGASLHNQPNDPIHEKVKAKLNDGYYAIALMGPGLWTTSGHFIVVWDWDSTVHINDPVSTRADKTNANPTRFKNEVKQYWLIDARKYNKGDDEMLSYEQFKVYMDRYLKERGELPAPKWTETTGEWAEAKEKGILAELDRPEGFTTRAETAAMVLRGLKNKEEK